MNNKSLIRYSLLLMVFVAILYGISYQQFHFFNLQDTRGFSDCESYMKMAQGNYDVNPTHKYRFLIPMAAAGVQSVVGLVISDPEKSLLLGFYAVNFAIVLGACLLLFEIFIMLKFSPLLSIIGVLIFCCNRVMIYTLGLPLVDSLFYFGICAVVYLSMKEKVWTLTLMLPLFILFKETMLPYLLIPLIANKKFRNPYYFASLSLAASAFVYSRHIIDSFTASAVQQHRSFVETVLIHVNEMYENLISLFSIGGIHDLQHGISTLLLLALIGMYLNRKEKAIKFPKEILLTIPMTILFFMLSSNKGRMLFTGFLFLIPFMLHALEYGLKKIKTSSSS
jgi:hypothetical protein